MCVKFEIEMTITWDWINLFVPFKLYCVAVTIEKQRANKMDFQFCLRKGPSPIGPATFGDNSPYIHYIFSGTPELSTMRK